MGGWKNLSKDHLLKPNEEIKELYEKVRDKIIALADNLEIQPQKLHIAIKNEKQNFVYIHIQ